MLFEAIGALFDFLFFFITISCFSLFGIAYVITIA